MRNPSPQPTFMTSWHRPGRDGQALIRELAAVCNRAEQRFDTIDELLRRWATNADDGSARVGEFAYAAADPRPTV